MLPAGFSAPHFDAFQAKSRHFDAVFELPQFESTPSELETSLHKALGQANDAFRRLGALKPAQYSVESVVRAYDDVIYDADTTASRIYLLKETHPDPTLREKATEMIKEYEGWAVGLDYREDLYQVAKGFAESQANLTGEDQRFLEEWLKDFRRAGMHLPKDQRDEIESLRKKLAAMETDFRTNITQEQAPLIFSRTDLEGLPESFLTADGIQTGPDQYTLLANVTFHYIVLMENARLEATRKRMMKARTNLVRDKNVPLLQAILELRSVIARQLGYASWADLKTEPKMAGDAATARRFLEDLSRGLQPKFDEEKERLRTMKAKATNQPDARLNGWDWRYFANQLKKEEYAIDTEQLRAFFPFRQTLEGMFRVYERVFGLHMDQVPVPQGWIEGLELHVISDASTGEPLGAVYLDMWPREGKFSHFAQFPIIPGKQLSNGKYRRPVVALICNFPPPEKDRPSLLSHDEVETLFHEFGHALHSVLTRARYARFSGTSVPRDFVEAPSQMLENWVWDKQVLDGFAADYRDPSRKIPPEILEQLEAAKLATVATFYRRQLSFGLLDLALHTEVTDRNHLDCVALSNRILDEIAFPVIEDTAFVANFGHLMGYDAGYYGYAWADAIAADLATPFEHAPERYFDRDLGLKLRREIYAPGNSRPVDESIRRFLGRERSIQPFLKKIGIRN